MQLQWQYCTIFTLYNIHPIQLARVILPSSSSNANLNLIQKIAYTFNCNSNICYVIAIATNSYNLASPKCRFRNLLIRWFFGVALFLYLWYHQTEAIVSQKIEFEFRLYYSQKRASFGILHFFGGCIRISCVILKSVQTHFICKIVVFDF